SLHRSPQSLARASKLVFRGDCLPPVWMNSECSAPSLTKQLRGGGDVLAQWRELAFELVR
ncbi:MAG: hypothetical protein ABI268_09000, partial [Rhodanobacter sp.]